MPIYLRKNKALKLPNNSNSKKIFQEEHAQEKYFENALDSMRGIFITDYMSRVNLSNNQIIACIQLIYACFNKYTQANYIKSILEEAKNTSIQDMIETSNLHAQHSDLPERWWDDDRGTMIATYGDTSYCVLVYSAAKQAYLMIDPNSLQPQLINSNLAANISRTAWIFCEPFPEENLTGKSLLKWALKNQKNTLIKTALTIIFAGLLSMLYPILVAWVIDPIIPALLKNQLLIISLALIVTALGKVGSMYLASLMQTRLDGITDNKLQKAVIDRVLRLPISFFNKFKLGDLAMRINGIDEIRQLFSVTFSLTITHMSIGMFSFFVMLYYQKKLAILVLLLLGIYFLVTLICGYFLLQNNKLLQDLMGKVQGTLFELVSIIEKIRLTGTERFAFANWATPYVEAVKTRLQQEWLVKRLAVFSRMMSYVVYFCIIAFIGWQSKELWAFFQTPDTWKKIDPGRIQAFISTSHFTAFYTAMAQLLHAFINLANVSMRLISIKPTYDRMEPVLKEPIKFYPKEGLFTNIEGQITLNSIYFKYSDSRLNILTDVNMDIQKNGCTIISGESGSGKSTLAQLLLSFLHPTSGTILLDNYDINLLNHHQLHGHLGAVLQTDQFVSGNIYENLRLGAPYTDDEIWDALEKVGIADYIHKLPMQLYTYINEGGKGFSAQQQRALSFARAFLRKPTILICDEALSGMDNMMQKNIIKTINSLNNTRIILTHKPSKDIEAIKLYKLAPIIRQE